MYSMKEVCKLTGMKYETLKYYCNEGLVPNVKRSENNYRVFDERDVAWIESLSCLKRCGMGIAEMKEYLALCLEGESSIPMRTVILAAKKQHCLSLLSRFKNPSTILTGNRISMMKFFPAKQNIIVI